LLVLLGLSIFAVKVLRYELPLTPADTRGMWQVELRITLRGDGRQGSVSAMIPASGTGQVVFDERSASDRLDFSIRNRGDARIGVWQGWLEGVHEIVYQFRARTFDVEVSLPDGPSEPPPSQLVEEYGKPTPEFPASAPEVAAVLERLALPPPANVADRVRTLYAFASHEIDTVHTAGSDAILALVQREGSPTGKSRLLVSFLRASGIPARMARGLLLRESLPPTERVWTEAYVGGVWLPMSSVEGTFGRLPEDVISLGSASGRSFKATGVRALGHRYHSMREYLRPEEVAVLMAPGNPMLERVSLYRLPMGTQQALRALLLLPLGALLVAVLRNLVGLPTYGTFMPLLVAFSLRGFPLGQGLALLAFVLVLGVASRLALERLRLLMVPRLAILLCIVVLSVAVLALVGQGTGNREFFAGVMFPIVILTMLVERFSIGIAEEGLRAALVPTLGSTLVAVAVYPALRSPDIEHLMFSFPELVFCIIGALVWIGGYTGYRLSDLARFRLFARPTGELR